MKILISILLTVLTTYQKGVYEDVGQIEMHCTPAAAHAVLDSLMADFTNAPEHMFAWAFYGTGEQKDDARKQGFIIHYDTVQYNPQTEVVYVTMTLFSPKGKMDKLHIEPVLWDHPATAASPRTIYFDIHEFKNLIKWIDAKLELETSDTTQVLHITTHCKFGWFFNMFISRKMYRNTVEWRIEQFLQNLRNTAEGRPLEQIQVQLE